MRIGIFGGSFDPIHTAHVAAAKAAREQLQLDRVLFVVAGNPPDGHKTVASYQQRAHMAELALKDCSWAQVSTIERENGGLRYTADTLYEVSRQYPAAELFLLIGEDKLKTLPQWFHASHILAMAHVAVFPRAVSVADNEDGINGCSAGQIRTESVPYSRIVFSQKLLSSTEVRKSVQNALPTSAILSPDTERYIYEEGIYFPGAVNLLRERMKNTLSYSRYSHVMGAVRQAAFLSDLYAPGDGKIADKARTAALLHDCAKQLPVAYQQRLSGDAEPSTEQVLHAFAGATLAKTAYGIRDDEILRAIYRHCTGESDMSLLDMITYLADLTEPGRDYPSVEAYRAILPEGPYQAMRYAVNGILTLLQKKGNEVHPATLRAMRWLENGHVKNVHV